MSSDATPWSAGRPAPAASLPAEHYLATITLFFAIGSLYAAIVRWNLLVPDGSHMSADAYNKAFTGHGVVMVFFFLIPSIPTTLGNFLLPLMIGAKDLAFP